MKFFKNLFKKDNRSPHEIFPEILYWEKGDNLSDTGDRTHSLYTYDGINEKGIIYYRYFDGTRYECHVKDAIPSVFGGLTNCSLINRNVDRRAESTTEYMQLMKDFQQAYSEISQ